MYNQKTLKQPFSEIGRGPFSGLKYKVTYEPAPLDHGIVYQLPNGSKVRANIRNAKPSRRSMILTNGTDELIHTEHNQATCYTYGLTNVLIRVEKVKPKVYSYSDRPHVYASRWGFEKMWNLFGSSLPYEFPKFEDRQLTICNHLNNEDIFPEVQEKEFPSTRVTIPFGNSMFKFIPIEGDDFEITAHIRYPRDERKSSLMDRTVDMFLDPDSYFGNIAPSKPYAYHLTWIPFKSMFIKKMFGYAIAPWIHPTFGIGRGLGSGDVFLPYSTREGLEDQENIFGELAFHSIEDRLGEISLLERYLIGCRCDIEFSDHANTISVLKFFDETIRPWLEKNH